MAIYGITKYGEDTYGKIIEISSVRCVERKKLEIILNNYVRFRSVEILLVDPVDQFTSVDWVAHGGLAYDAANPANYSLSRPAGGNLSEPGYASDPTPIYLEPIDGYWVEKTELSGIEAVYAKGFYLTTDFQFTPEADYRLTIANIVIIPGGVPIAPPDDEEDFVGWVVSHIPRSSLHLFDILPKIAQRLDQEGTGDLELFCQCLQEPFDRILEDTDDFFSNLCSIEYAREEFLDAILYDLGDQFSEVFALTTNEKRKLIKSLVPMYRLKGTCVGIIQVIDYFMTITIIRCTGGWDDTWELAKGTYPTQSGGDLLYKGAYPAPTGGSTILGPVGEQIYNFWLLHAAPGTLTADQLAKIAKLVDLWKPAYTHYMGVKAP